MRTEGLLNLNLPDLMSQVDPRDYGTQLGQAFFQADIRDAFVRVHAENREALRILLDVEAPDLKNLHWEHLCAPIVGA